MGTLAAIAGAAAGTTVVPRSAHDINSGICSIHTAQGQVQHGAQAVAEEDICAVAVAIKLRGGRRCGVTLCCCGSDGSVGLALHHHAQRLCSALALALAWARGGGLQERVYSRSLCSVLRVAVWWLRLCVTDGYRDAAALVTGPVINLMMMLLLLPVQDSHICSLLHSRLLCCCSGSFVSALHLVRAVLCCCLACLVTDGEHAAPVGHGDANGW